MRDLDQPSAKFETLLGYSVYAEPLNTFRSDVEKYVMARPPVEPCRIISCMNPHSYAVAKQDPEFKASLEQSFWLIPDGIGAVYASRYNRGRIRDRITGGDVFHAINKIASDKKLPIFLLGATEETLSDIEKRLAIDYPGAIVAGTLAPPFKPSFSNADILGMVEEIKRAKPRILWVGLSAPKQEKWAAKFLKHAGDCDVAVVGCIGAVFDFYTGRVKRASPSLQKIGLEWLPRLLQEPRRLWRRMFVSAPIFVFDVITFKLRGKNRGHRAS